MKAIVKSNAGYYARKNGRPAWVEKQQDAKVFRNRQLAQGVVRVMSYSGVKAQVIPLPGKDAHDQRTE